MSDGLTGGAFFPWLVLLRDLSAKSALLLLAAWALTLTMRRASAAARHLVWVLTFAGLLLLPLLSVTLPTHSVAVLPPPAAPVVQPPSVIMLSPAKPSAAAEAPAYAVPGERPIPPLPALPPPARALPVRALPPAVPNWPALLCCLWLLGVALAALPRAAGWTLAVRRLRRCSPVTDPATLALAAEAGNHLGLHHPISLRSGPAVSVPVTFGLLRPVILLPDGAASWPAERLRVALLHELAHIRRGDWATQTAARLVCALFWCNPLVWPAARMLRAEAERACDDLVLSSGVPAPDYAQHLLAVAAALAGANRPLPLAVPMAGRGPLESRLRAVLTARPRRAPSRRSAALAFVLVLSVLVPLAVLRPAARAARRIAPLLPLAPAVIPAPPKAVGHFHAPLKVAVAIPSAPSLLLIPTKPTPTGVPPMKPLMPAKAVALTALAAALTLPAAYAKPTELVKHIAASKRAHISADELRREIIAYQKRDRLAFQKAYPPVPAALALHWNAFVLQHVPIKTVMALLPWGPGGKSPEGVKEIMFSGDNMVLINATPAGYAQVQEAVKRLDVAPEAMAVIPRQVQIKFEWVSSANTPNAAPDKSVDALTIIAEEGRKAQVSSQHLRNGTGGEETISVLPHLEAGGVVVLDITERTDSTARVGDTKAASTEITVQVKDGETKTVRFQVSNRGGQSSERVLFVTPTIIHPAADGSVEPRSAPLRDGDIINVNPLTASPPVGRGPGGPVPDKAP